MTEAGGRIPTPIYAKRNDGVTVPNFPNWTTVIALQGIIYIFYIFYI